MAQDFIQKNGKNFREVKNKWITTEISTENIGIKTTGGNWLQLIK
jgi:hypothetical protein